MKSQSESSIVCSFSRWTRKSWSLFSVIGKVVRIGVLAITYFLAAEPATAQKNLRLVVDHESEETDVQLEEVEVLGQRISISNGQLARLVTVISRQEIARSSYTSIADLLDQQLSIDIRQRGQDGAQADISLNGSTFEQVLVLINGIPVNNPQSGHFAGDIPVPLDLVDHIEIIAGGASRWLGPLAYAGAVNIVTRTAASNEARVGLGAGQHGYWSAKGSVHSGKKYRQHFGVEHLQHQGFSENTDLKTTKGFYLGETTVGSGDLTLQAGIQQKSFGAQAFYTPLYPEQFEQTGSAFASAGFHNKGRVSHTHQGYVKVDRDEFHLFRNESPVWYRGPNNHRTTVFGLQNNLWWQSKIGMLSLGLDFRQENILSTVLGEVTDTITSGKGIHFNHRADRQYASLYAEHSVQKGAWSLVTGVMSTLVSDAEFRPGVFPGIDLKYRAKKRLHLFLSANRSMRYPSFTELYYQSPTTIGNPGLEPEKAWSSRIGFSHSGGWISTKGQLYLNLGQNEIDWVKYPDETVWKALNVAQVYRGGLEAEARVRPLNLPDWTRVELNVGYAWNHLIHSAGAYDSKYVLDYARHKLVTGVSAPVGEYFRFDLQARYLDREGFYSDWDETGVPITVDYRPYVLVDLRMDFYLRNVTVWSTVNNVLNADYVDIGHVAQPGRWLRFGVEIEFSH